ncbi:MAG: zinc ABC transporter substrate-binding protein [Clostridia bacterium]|nr:zinc ABC transporter substrate-binding protein [Clostridia bacterium]
MKKITALILVLVLALGVFAACGKEPSGATEKNTDNAPSGKSISIVTTIFPEYDWVRNIIQGSSADIGLTMLLDSGVDLHSFQPSADDILKIGGSDLFIHVGGESDEWVEGVLEQKHNPDLIELNLLEMLGDRVKAEEIKEGMEAGHDHEHSHEEIEESDVKDRSLDEFNGEWKSLFPMLEDGELDEYIEHEAEEDGEAEENVKKTLAEKWACEAVKISINGGSVTFVFADGKTVSAEYKYAGYSLIRAEDGDVTGVRYQFETDSSDAPKYIQFNDHCHEPSEEIGHFHFYFGNEGFNALSDSATDPLFFAAAASAGDILGELTEGHSHEEESDEHVWLSLKNAVVLCGLISEEICRIDPGNADIYRSNTAEYTEQLKALDAEYEALVSNSKIKTLLFCDRFPFRYLTDDYGLDYYAAFVGCSAESEASFETVAFLTQKLDELSLPAVITIESSDKSIAKTVIENSSDQNRRILTMDSLQSTVRSEVDNGKTYIGVMRSNLDVLREALA